MDKMITRFPTQIREAIKIGRAATIKRDDRTLNKVYVAGMGGSGIGAEFVRALVRDELPVPFLTGKGYDIPACIDDKTLAIISSYSGNTEETLQSMEAIEARGARVVCIASGGKVIDQARIKEHDHIVLPAGWSSPRACLGYSMINQLYVLQKVGLISHVPEDDFLTAADYLDEHMTSIRERAKSCAGQITGKTPVIYCEDRLEPIAIRLRQQINENAKMLCWHHVIPEMNHNELVGWKDKRNDLVVLVLSDGRERPHNQVRMNITRKIVEDLSSVLCELKVDGDSPLVQMLQLIHIGDWISWYLAQARRVDAVEIDVIDFLKAELGKEN